MKKVLIVDDTKNIRTLLSMCLELEGYQITMASDGKEGLALIQNEAFDLVFLDIKLPEMSGTEVLRKIKEIGVQTPIIIMTAFATVKNAVECTKLGAVTYLQKPFTAEKIRRVLKEINENISSNLQEQNLETCLSRAKQLMAVGKMVEAYQQLKNALAVNPHHGETYRLIAAIYEEQGNTKESERFKMIAQQFEET